MRKIILAIVIVVLLVIAAFIAIELKSRHDRAVQQQGYANALKSMKQTGHDEHDTNYMNPTK